MHSVSVPFEANNSLLDEVVSPESQPGSIGTGDRADIEGERKVTGTGSCLQDGKFNSQFIGRPPQEEHDSLETGMGH